MGKRKRKSKAPKKSGVAKKPRKEDKADEPVETTVPDDGPDEKESKEEVVSKEEVPEESKEKVPDEESKEEVPEESKGEVTDEESKEKVPEVSKVEVAEKDSKETETDSKSNTASDDDTKEEPPTTSIYDFKANDITGKEVSLDKYKGHVCIIVNVASRCGHTKVNYEQLVELHEKYGESKGLRILAFPCNQFGKQEPRKPEEISEFCKKRNVEFDLFDKVNVNGKDAHPLWKYLQETVPGKNGTTKIDWNFTKFIVDKEGKVVERHKPGTKPLQMVEDLEKYW